MNDDADANLENGSSKKWATAVYCLFAILLVLAILSIFIPLYGDIYIGSEHTDNEYSTAYHMPLFFLLTIGRLLDQHNGAVVAVATIFIAIFTLRLKVSTDRLRTSGEKQIKVSEKQTELTAMQTDLTAKQHALSRHVFFVTNKPNLVIRRLIFTKLPDAVSYKVSWKVANSGGSDCNVTESNGTLAFLTVPLPDLPQYDHHRDTFGNNVAINSGTAIDCEKILDLPIDKELVKRLSQKDANPQRMYFFGFAKYEAALGGARNLGFCFVYDAATRRFTEVDDPNYKYSE